MTSFRTKGRYKAGVARPPRIKRAIAAIVTLLMASSLALVSATPAMAAAPVFATAPLPNGQVGQSYSGAVRATSDTAVNYFQNGFDVPGLSLPYTGDIVGIPTTPGTYTFSVTAQNTDGSATQDFTLTVLDRQPPSFTGPRTFTTRVNEYLAVNITTQGTPSPTISVAPGSTLPAGLRLSGPTLFGTPTQPGTFSFDLVADNGASTTAVETFSVDILSGPVFTAASPPGGELGTPYSYSFAATGYRDPQFSVSSGQLPPGLTLTPQGALSGTPSAAGRYRATVIAQNASGFVEQQVMIDIVSAPVFTFDSPPMQASLNSGQRLNYPFGASGFPEPTYTVNGVLPTGITLSGSSLYGFPRQLGTFTYSITATNSQGSVTTATHTLEIVTGPAFTTDLPGYLEPNAAVDFQYVTDPGATSYAVTAGDFPTGLTLSPTGAITGTPTEIGLYHFTVSATGRGGTTAFSERVFVGDPRPLILSDPSVIVPDGQDITLTGERFVPGATQVRFQAIEGMNEVTIDVPAEDMTATSITLRAPAYNGIVPEQGINGGIVVITPVGTSAQSSFTYQRIPVLLNSLSRTEGFEAGGYPVTLSGLCYVEGKTRVLVNGALVTSALAADGTSIAITMPAGTGTVPVTVEGDVRNCTGTSTALPSYVASAPLNFTYLAPVAAELSLTKSGALAQGASGFVGDIVTWTFSVENTGTATATGVMIVDTLPGLSDLAYTWPADDGVLRAGETATATATSVITAADVAAGGLTNVANVIGTSSDGVDFVGPDVSSNTVAARDRVTAELMLTKTGALAAGANGVVGDVVTWSFSVENTGLVAATGVTVVDTLPGLSGLTYVWPGTEGSLEPGEVVTASASSTITADDIEAGGATNVAHVTATSTDGVDFVGPEVSSNTVPARDPDSPSTPVPSEPLPGQVATASSVSGQVPGASGAPGGELAFTGAVLRAMLFTAETLVLMGALALAAASWRRRATAARSLD